MKRLLFAACLVAAAVALSPAPASASSRMLVGLYDDAQVLGNPQKSFPMLRTLRTQIVRANLHWGDGGIGVARRKPKNATNPNDPAYDWGIYDRLVTYAARNKIKVVFSIVGTPRWANGGRAANRAPTNAAQLRSFAFAAAKRYSGVFKPTNGPRLPAVKLWLAWNEPNNPIFLNPQYKRQGGRWIIQSARDYARICNAIRAGIKGSLVRGEKVACGVTAPRGNNLPRGARPSVSPLAFLRAMRQAGARGFDAYAHHPYAVQPGQTPRTVPARTALTMANIGDLSKELRRLYGNGMRIWVTEYGYQTRPDRFFGVTYAQQANYMRSAYRIARTHPKIDMFLWFLLRDERKLSGWQSGLLTSSGKKKPAFRTFQFLRG